MNSILADGKGGFWLGGQTALVHWHDGISETYPIQGLKSNAGQPGIVGSGAWYRWIPLGRHFADGPGRGLGRLIDGASNHL